MTRVELKRGYEVLPDNNVRFGIKVINTSDYAILGVSFAHLQEPITPCR